MSAPDWVGQELVEPDTTARALNPSQEKRLLEQIKLLRDDLTNLMQVSEIKCAIAREDYDEAIAMWQDFTEEEQIALWVAPKFGGIFTTHERKIIKEHKC